MKAAVLHQVGAPLEICDVNIEKPGPHEVLVRTAAVGLCHSDLHIMDGSIAMPLPVVLGHEVAGVVEAVGLEVRGLAPGDHVVGCLAVFCGHCTQCLSGRQNLCEDVETKQPPGRARRLSMGKTHVGQAWNLSAFAEQMLVHENALVKITPDMPLDRAALLSCAVITGTGAVFRTAAVPPGSTVAVLGCGGVGLCTINGASIVGASRIVAIDTNPRKLEFARQFGATDCIDASKCDPVEAITDLIPGGVQFSFECVGLPLTTAQAFRMLGIGGVATVMGLFKDGTEVPLLAGEFRKEKKIQGSVMGSNKLSLDIKRLVDLYMNGKLQLDALISNRIQLGRINEGFDAMIGGEVARSIITFDDVLSGA